MNIRQSDHVQYHLVRTPKVNVGGDIVRKSFLIRLAGIVFALAFGLGGKAVAAELIDQFWPRQGKSDGD
jgi:hypothetical protein